MRAKQKDRRVAITGLGVVSPLGNDVQTTWMNLIGGKSGMDVISRFDASAFPTRIAAEVRGYETPSAYSRELRHSCVFAQYALGAALQAFEDASIRPMEGNSRRWGCVVGAGMMMSDHAFWQGFQQRYAVDGSMDYARLNREGHRETLLSEFSKSVTNSGLTTLTRAFGIRGYSNSVHTACASGGQALGLALQALRRGECDRMLVGGFDSMLNPVGLSSFCLLGALSTYNESPHSASRPFDLTRNGFVLGEGAAFMVIESWEAAEARGAKIYAELAGEGNSLSSYRITDSHPSGDGAIQSIHGAMKQAGVTPDEVDYINAHGTSTKMNDLSETNAIKEVFGDRAASIPVSSTKSQTGHLIAAAGALEGVLTVLSMHHGLLPMTMNLQQPDPDCDLDYITEGVRKSKVRVALSNSFGFGGSNSSVAFIHPEHSKERAT